MPRRKWRSDSTQFHVQLVGLGFLVYSLHARGRPAHTRALSTSSCRTASARSPRRRGDATGENRELGDGSRRTAPAAARPRVPKKRGGGGARRTTGGTGAGVAGWSFPRFRERRFSEPFAATARPSIDPPARVLLRRTPRVGRGPLRRRSRATAVQAASGS